MLAHLRDLAGFHDGVEEVTFDEAFERLYLHERGFTNDPRDRGNWTGGKVGVGECKGTKYGISAAAYPAEDIAGLTVDRAKFLYKRDYWDKFHCPDVPETIRFDFFDGVVNSGPGSKRSGKQGAVRWLQRSADVNDDGVFGPVTLTAVRQMNPYLLAARYNGHRLDSLNDIETWSVYGRGWAQRIAENLIALK